MYALTFSKAVRNLIVKLGQATINISTDTFSLYIIILEGQPTWPQIMVYLGFLCCFWFESDQIEYKSPTFVQTLILL